MDPELQKQLAAYLQAIADTAQQGAGFVMEQAPLVVQEKVLYGRVTATSFTVGLLAVIALCVYGLTWCARNPNSDADEAIVPASMLGGLIALAVLVFAALPSMAKVWFAPRLYILEWAMGLIK